MSAPRDDTPAQLVLQALQCTRSETYTLNPNLPGDAPLRSWIAYCPVCPSRLRTLTVTESGEGGPVSVRCSTGCERETIMGELADAVRRDPSTQRTAS